MRKLIAKILTVLFPSVYGIGLPADEDIRARSEWLGNDLDIWQGLAKAKPQPEIPPEMERQLAKIRKMNERAAFVEPCHSQTNLTCNGCFLPWNNRRGQA